MKKILIVHLILSLALGLRCSTIAVLDLSAVTPYTIINQTNMTAYENETVSADTDTEQLEPVVPNYFNDVQMEANVTEILSEPVNLTNQTSAVISNYVEVFVFNEYPVHNTSDKPLMHTTRSQVFLVTPDEISNNTNDSYAAFNISIYENTFSFSASSTSKFICVFIMKFKFLFY